MYLIILARVILILITYLCSCNQCEAYGILNKGIGEKCQINNLEGECISYNDCFEAKMSATKGEKPVVCSFQSRNPIVCCKSQKTSLDDITRGANIDIKPPVPLSTTISQKKCIEYGESVFINVPSPDPNSSEPFIKVAQCEAEFKTLVVGGVKADVKEFPHMAILGYYENNEMLRWLCGGSLISHNFVLTAAHCLSWRNIEPSVVHLGLIDLTNRNKSGSLQEIKVKQVIQHPEYKRNRRYHDIGLLRLENPAVFTEFVRAACLHSDFNIPTESAFATGWGKDSFHADKGTDYLMRVKLALVQNNDCKNYYTNPSDPFPDKKLPNGIQNISQFCAGDFNSKKDTCNGDSGGPFQIKRKDLKCMYDLIGITSFGVSCGIVPGVYTRISNYVPWIETIVWNERKHADVLIFSD